MKVRLPGLCKACSEIKPYMVFDTIESVRKIAEHPMQPLVWDDHEVIRFKQNKIIQWLFDTGKLDLNAVHTMGFPIEDHVQIAQLLGYSVSDVGDLSYMPDDFIAEADRQAAEMIAALKDGRCTICGARISPMSTETVCTSHSYPL